jgi:hypothetical protein
MHPLYAILILILGSVVVLSIVQPLPSFLLLLPILFFTVLVGSYLNRHIQKEHEENLKQGLQYAVDEQNAEHWMHESFIPKTKILLKKHIKELIAYTGALLILFIFFWTYVVAGYFNALLAVFIAAVLYTLFVYYLLHADKWYRYFFKHIPKPYRRFKDNDWIHGYMLLLPFSLLCNVLYIIFNYNANLLTLLFSLPVFLFIYTLTFLCLYCGIFLYREYRKEEERKMKEHVEKILEE